MYPNGLFGLDALRVLISPIAIFGIVFFILYLRNDRIKAGRAVLLLLAIGVFAVLGAKLFSLHVRGWELYEPLSSELRGGLRYPGALLGMILVGPLLKRSFPRCTGNNRLLLFRTGTVQLFYERLLHRA